MAESKAYSTFPNLGDYGCFLSKKEEYLYHPWEEEADRLFAEGKQEETIHGLKDDSNPSSP